MRVLICRRLRFYSGMSGCLTEAAAFAHGLGLPPMVHHTDSDIPVETVLDRAGRLKRCLFRARYRGVVFDAAHGLGNFSIPVAGQAPAELTLFERKKPWRTKDK